jgi:hypothetical protein
MKTKEIDPVVEEIRAGRVQISRSCGNDPARVVKYLQAFNKKYSKEVSRYRRGARRQAAVCSA